MYFTQAMWRNDHAQTLMIGQNHQQPTNTDATRLLLMQQYQIPRLNPPECAASDSLNH